MKWLVVATILVFLVVSAVVTESLPKTYDTTATIRVSPAEPRTETNVPVNPYTEVQASQVLARTNAELLKSRSAFEEAVEQRKLPVSVGELRNVTKVAYVDGTDLIQVQVTATDPRQVSELANSLAEAFIAVRSTDRDANLVLASPATPPTQDSGPSLRLNLALALVLGTAVAVAGALLLSRFRGYVSSPEEVEELVGAPILKSLPRNREYAKGEYAKHPSKSSAFEEAIGAVRVNLDFALDNVGNGSGRAILVTSALPGEGATVVSCALAASYARAGHECLIVDAALREPQVHDYFSVRNTRGLSDFLVEESKLPHVSVSRGKESTSTHEPAISTLKDNPNLSILFGGKRLSNPVDLLSSDRTQELIHNLRERFDTVILDSPPAFPFVDASILGGQVDGIVLIVDKKARRRALLRAVDQLRSGKGRIVGVVLT